MNFIEVNGVRLHYRFDGPEEFPVLVLSNSLGTDLSMWNPQIEELTKHFRVLRYDARGHGQSDVPAGPYSIEQLGQDVVGLLDGLEIERAHFAGVSMGGMTGMWLALNVPERLGKMAFCNTAAFIGPRTIWDARISAVQDGGMAAITEGVLARWFTESYLEKGPDEAEQVRRVLLGTSPDGYALACAAVRDMDLRDAVKSIAVPALVISGKADLATPPRDGQYLAEQIRGARYVELSGAHLSNIEISGEFTRELVNFLLGHS
ncbi:3-oxoadipate enol-lactonase [Neobacillus muris]|uniref:3-oxoadipate enol-lactonase n=1 Tax=Neobacillus muris TaxID=2941334 RepID=UPI00203CBDBB|nr:3-oxoadipate enol-lactonase [Neobacillus muris]